jgi:hypothetical protein
MLTEYPDIVSQRKFIKDIAPEMELKTLQNQISQGLIPVTKIGKKTYINMYAIKKNLQNDYKENQLFLKKFMD